MTIIREATPSDTIHLIQESFWTPSTILFILFAVSLCSLFVVLNSATKDIVPNKKKWNTVRIVASFCVAFFMIGVYFSRNEGATLRQGVYMVHIADIQSFDDESYTVIDHIDDNHYWVRDLSTNKTN